MAAPIILSVQPCSVAYEGVTYPGFHIPESPRYAAIMIPVDGRPKRAMIVDTRKGEQSCQLMPKERDGWLVSTAHYHLRERDFREERGIIRRQLKAERKARALVKAEAATVQGRLF
jgi:hypothetical protein